MGMTPNPIQTATALVSASGMDEPSTSRADGTVVEMHITLIRFEYLKIFLISKLHKTLLYWHSKKYLNFYNELFNFWLSPAYSKLTYLPWIEQ